MITVLIKATDPYKLNDLIRSLINNAESRDNFRIVVGGDSSYSAIVDDFRDRADIELLSEGDTLFSGSKLLWILNDEVFILGRVWDKRLLYYANNFPDGIVTMFPSGYKSYNSSNEFQIATMAEKNPVVSTKWFALAGGEDVEMVSRELFLTYGIDRRIDVRLVDVIERGAIAPRTPYDLDKVKEKAKAIAEYIKNFTQSGT